MTGKAFKRIEARVTPEIENEVHIDIFFQKFYHLCKTEDSDVKILEFVYNYIENLIDVNNYSIIDLLLSRVNINDIKISLLLGFLTVAFHEKSKLSSYQPLLDKVCEKIKLEIPEPDASRIIRRFQNNK